MGVRGLRVAFGKRKRGAFVGQELRRHLARQQPRPRPCSTLTTITTTNTNTNTDTRTLTTHVTTTHDHRDYAEVKRLLNRARLDADARALAGDIFARIAEVEAKLHGTKIDRVAFHEVGALRFDRRRRRCRGRDRLPGARVDRIAAAGRRHRPRPHRARRGAGPGARDGGAADRNSDPAGRRGRADDADGRRHPGRGRRPSSARCRRSRCAPPATARARSSFTIARTSCAPSSASCSARRTRPPRRRCCCWRRTSTT